MRDQTTLESMGFMTRQGGVHVSRTIMLDELNTLFGQVEADAPPAAYQAAVRDQVAERLSDEYGSFILRAEGVATKYGQAT